MSSRNEGRRAGVCSNCQKNTYQLLAHTPHTDTKHNRRLQRPITPTCPFTTQHQVKPARVKVSENLPWARNSLLKYSVHFIFLLFNLCCCIYVSWRLVLCVSLRVVMYVSSPTLLHGTLSYFFSISYTYPIIPMSFPLSLIPILSSL